MTMIKIIVRVALLVWQDRDINWDFIASHLPTVRELESEMDKVPLRSQSWTARWK